MLTLLSLILVSSPAQASILRSYDLSNFAEGTCTPMIVTAPAKVARIVIGTAFAPDPAQPSYRYAVSAAEDGVKSVEVCWPDQVGRAGAEPTSLVVYSDFDDGPSLHWTVPAWTAGRVVVPTKFGKVQVVIGTSRAISAPAK